MAGGHQVKVLRSGTRHDSGGIRRPMSTRQAKDVSLSRQTRPAQPTHRIRGEGSSATP